MKPWEWAAMDATEWEAAEAVQGAWRAGKEEAESEKKG
jgi:hypothetical protein